MTSVNFVDSDRVVSAINYASDSLNQLISINDNEITILNEKTIQLRSELEIIDSDYILSATASARSQLRTEIQQEGDRITVLSQDIVTLNSSGYVFRHQVFLLTPGANIGNENAH